MAYQDNETSSSSGQPIELYKFEGTYNDYFLTSHEEDITSNGQVYTAIAMGKNRLNVGTQENTDNALTVNLPYDHPMVVEYAYLTTPPELLLTILRCHAADYDDTVTIWVGNVTNFLIEKNVAKARVPSIFSYILGGVVPSVRYQGPCNHVLYDGRCGVNPLSHQFTGTVTEITSNVITLSGLTGLGTNEASAGLVFNSSGEARMIVSNTGSDITLSYPFAGVEVGDTLTIRRGCDHSLTTCRTTFSNVPRFGGFPSVPDYNPFSQSSLKS